MWCVLELDGVGFGNFGRDELVGVVVEWFV